VSERTLVTGGTGALGRVVVGRLLDAGRGVRVMSRRPRPVENNGRYGWATADLRFGNGVEEAVAEVDVIVHCATAFGRGREVHVARTVVKAAKRAGSPHLVYVSIVGVDRVPFGYYQGKLESERLIERSGLPYTILRATQFHGLVRTMFASMAKAPVMPVPGRGSAGAEPATWPVKSGMPVGGEDARWAQRDGPHVRALRRRRGAKTDRPPPTCRRWRRRRPRSNLPYPTADGP
jgi:uncharacterized protein YbjT (DUF2867 family)